MKVLLVGGGAREHAIARALTRNGHVKLFAASQNTNPGIRAFAQAHEAVKETDPGAVLAVAKRHGVDYAVIGPEAPLAAGVSDALSHAGIHVASPSRTAAEIETNKLFMRRLLERHHVAGNVEFHYFEDAHSARKQLKDGDLKYAIKPVGLTGGKGVRVYGDHFDTLDQAGAYVDDVIKAGAGGHGVLLEQLLEGEEFTVQAVTDGKTVVPTIAVQDHKRLLPDDRGPNTGGMGSYSQADGLLPFLPRNDWDEAVAILQRIVEALSAEDRPYVGPIYGQFMLTNDGPYVIEINARYGDPEAMNVLSLLKSDYAELVKGMVEERLNNTSVDFESLASVVKYVVPEGYGSEPRPGSSIQVDEAGARAAGGEVYYASVNEAGKGIVKTTTSRAVAVLGRGETIREANDACEDALAHVRGEHIFVRHDIGSHELIEKRVKHMQLLTKGA